jgi:hypothetical protein
MRAPVWDRPSDRRFDLEPLEDGGDEHLDRRFAGDAAAQQRAVNQYPPKCFV